MDKKVEEWNNSYSRQENFIFYPMDEVVKFLSRYVRRKTGIDQFKDLLESPYGLKGLDFGCGIGRNTVLLEEFGLEGYGVELSSKALSVARELAIELGYKEMRDRFKEASSKLPFIDNYFDISISTGVLDSMPFPLAKENMKEIARVTKKYIFCSVISGDDSSHSPGYSGEEVVQTDHEHGTIQSYYNFEKIEKLIEDTPFVLKDCRLLRETNIIANYYISRFYVVFERQ